MKTEEVKTTVRIPKHIHDVMASEVARGEWTSLNSLFVFCCTQYVEGKQRLREVRRAMEAAGVGEGAIAQVLAALSGEEEEGYPQRGEEWHGA